jgi:hypothetical protein
LRFLRRFALLALFLSAASFARLFYSGSDYEWCPVNLPIPGPGLAVTSRFTIATPGEFWIEVDSPRTSVQVGAPEPPPVKCDLRLAIEGPDHNAIGQSIQTLSWCGFGNLDIYRTNMSHKLHRSGDYTFRLLNQGDSKFFATQGASVRFTRFRKPTEWYMGNLFLKAIGKCLLLLGVLSGLASEVQDFLLWRSFLKKT